MEQCANFIRTAHQMTQGPQSLGLHIGEAKHSSPPKMMRFDLAPYPFIRIQVRTIRRQRIQSEPPLKALNFCRHLSGLVHGMTIEDQKHRPAASNHQAIQKSADYAGIQAAFFNHKTHLPTTIHRTQQIQPVSCARTSYHRRLPLRPPGRPRMIVATQTRFIPKPNLRPHLPRFLSNRRVFLLDPLPNPLWILLIGPPKGLLRSNPQLRQQTPYRVYTQAYPVLAIDQCPDCFPCPQGVNGKVKVYQLWENKSVPPLGRKKELMRGQQAWDHLLVWGKDSC